MHSDVLVRRIRDHAQRIRACPTLDEVVVLRALHLLCHVRRDPRLASADAQCTEPCPKHLWLQPMLLRQARDTILVRRAGNFRRRTQIFRRAAEDFFALHTEPVHCRAQIP